MVNVAVLAKDLEQKLGEGYAITHTLKYPPSNISIESKEEVRRDKLMSLLKEYFKSQGYEIPHETTTGFLAMKEEKKYFIYFSVVSPANPLSSGDHFSVWIDVSI